MSFLFCYKRRCYKREMLEERWKSGLKKDQKISLKEVPLELDVEIRAEVCPANERGNQAKSQIAL